MRHCLGWRYTTDKHHTARKCRHIRTVSALRQRLSIISLWGPLLSNLRAVCNSTPTLLDPCLTSLTTAATDDIHWTLVRENFVGRRCRPRRPVSSSTAHSAFGIERVMRLALDTARAHATKLVITHSMRNASPKVVLDFPHVAWVKILGDAMTVRMVIPPQPSRTHGPNRLTCISDPLMGIAPTLTRRERIILHSSARSTSAVDLLHGCRQRHRQGCHRSGRRQRCLSRFGDKESSQQLIACVERGCGDGMRQHVDVTDIVVGEMRL